MSVALPPGSQPENPPLGPPVKMKIRPDLTFDRQYYQGVEYWVIKEPLGQKYYQFPPHVFYLLQQLDGQRSIEELQENYQREFSPKRITRHELQQLLTRFHRDGLVVSDMSGQGVELLERGRKNVAMERLTSLSNILAIRYRGFDPERILNFLNRWTWWLFTPAAVIAVAIFASIALFSVLMNFSEFQARLPGFDQFFDPRRWYMFVGVLAVTKVFHEFGHGLSCKRLGGECHEIGFMLLVLTPCLYCNVSDSWRLKNKWHRAAIGAAGMYVEIILATIATFIWWYVQPGMIQDICLQVMLVSSVSTILFNGNPLLRFDGYYILSDILEIPNLQQKSSKALTTLLGRHWLGLEIPDDQLMPSNRPLSFAMFTVAAFLYRWFILFAIVTFLTIWLEPYGLESVGQMIAIFAVFGMLLWPSYKLYNYMSVPGRMHQVKKTRFFVTLAVVIAFVALILFIPLPHNLRCDVILVPNDMETIYVEQAGQLVACEVTAGEQVQPNQTLATIRNIDLDIALVDARNKLKQKKSQREMALTNSAVFDEARQLDLLTTLDAEIEQLQHYVTGLEEQTEDLTLKSSIAGTVLATPYRHPEAEKYKSIMIQQQPFLSGRNEKVAVTPGMRFCEVADLSRWRAIVLLTENQIKFVKTGQKARIKLYSAPGVVIESEVESIGMSDRTIQRKNFDINSDFAQQRASLPDLVAEMVAQHQQSDLQYYAKVPINNSNGQMKIGIGGQARLASNYRSIGARLWWWINQNFRS